MINFMHDSTVSAIIVTHSLTGSWSPTLSFT